MTNPIPFKGLTPPLNAADRVRPDDADPISHYEAFRAGTLPRAPWGDGWQDR